MGICPTNASMTQNTDNREWPGMKIELIELTEENKKQCFELKTADE